MKDPVIISVGGGKGGIGKSTVTANMGAVLARKGFRVGFIDADLGGANLHLCLGVKRPAAGLQDYLSGARKTLPEVATETIIKGSWLISGASDILELANPNFAQKQKIITNLRKMDADYILVDLGAGSDYHVTDFYAAFPFGIVVTDGLPTSVENAYGFLKNGVLRGLVRLFPGKAEIQALIKGLSDPRGQKKYATVDEMLSALNASYPEEVTRMRQWLHQRRTLLVLNMIKGNEEIRIGERFSEIVKKYLSLSLHYIGYVMYAPEIRTSIKQMRPVMLTEEPSKAKECFEAITSNLVALTKDSGEPSMEPSKPRKGSSRGASGSPGGANGKGGAAK